MKSKYKYEIDATLDHNPNKPLYRLKTTKAGKEITKVVGISQLKSMYTDGRINGHIPPYLKEKIGAPRRKVRSDKGLKKGESVRERVAPKWNLKDLVIERKWNLPDEFKVSAIKAYCYSDPSGRWHVVMPDGTEDEDTYPTEKWAQDWVDTLNKDMVDNLKE